MKYTTVEGWHLQDLYFKLLDTHCKLLYSRCKLLDKYHKLLVDIYGKLLGWAQRLINLEIPVLVRSLKSRNVELGLDETLFKCCLSVLSNPSSCLDLILVMALC